MLQRTAKSTLSARVPTTNAAFRAASPPSLAKLWPGLDRRRRLEARVVREPLPIGLVPQPSGGPVKAGENVSHIRVLDGFRSKRGFR